MKQNLLTAEYWNPYLVGIGIGVLSWLVFLVVDKPLGMSTEISKFSGTTTSMVTGWDAVKENPYWAKKTPKFGYSTVFLIFTGIGAFLSAKLGKTFAFEKVPTVWREHISDKPAIRYLAAFIGGFIILYGARMAGGCTSGHGISGTLQLAVSGWVFFMSMFVTGVITAAILFRKRA
jgi:hypothetical protein